MFPHEDARSEGEDLLLRQLRIEREVEILDAAVFLEASVANPRAELLGVTLLHLVAVHTREEVLVAQLVVGGFLKTKFQGTEDPWAPCRR